MGDADMTKMRPHLVLAALLAASTTHAAVPLPTVVSSKPATE